MADREQAPGGTRYEGDNQGRRGTGLEGGDQAPVGTRWEAGGAHLRCEDAVGLCGYAVAAGLKAEFNVVEELAASGTEADVALVEEAATGRNLVLKLLSTGRSSRRHGDRNVGRSGPEVCSGGSRTRLGGGLLVRSPGSSRARIATHVDGRRVAARGGRCGETARRALAHVHGLAHVDGLTLVPGI